MKSSLLQLRRQHTHKHQDEISDDSIKYRLEYENNGLLINDRLFQRQLFRTQTENVIDTLTLLNRITDSHNTFNPAKIQLSPLKTNEVKQQNTQKFFLQRNLTQIDLKANPNLNEDLFIAPNWSMSATNKTNKKSTTPESDTQSTSTDENQSSKRFIKSRNRLSKQKRLRNLLDNGDGGCMSDSSMNLMERSNTLILSDNSNNLFLNKLNRVNNEKQIKQIDAYKKFKAELGFSFSRRLPNTTIQLTKPKLLIKASKC